MRAIPAVLAVATLAVASAAARDIEPAVFGDIDPRLAWADWSSAEPVEVLPDQYGQRAQQGVWLAGAGVYALRPTWGNNPALAVYQLNTAPATITSATHQQDFDYDLQFGPLVWLGYVNRNGLGLRARWWRLQSAAAASAVNPAEDDPDATTTVYSAWPLGIGVETSSSATADYVLSVGGRLTMDVVDVEALGGLRPGRWSVVFGGGVRYAHLAQGYDATLTGTPSDPAFDSELARLRSGHSFSGVGPTILLEASRPLGHTWLSFFWNTRGALLFGSGTGRSAVSSQILDSNQAVTSERTSINTTSSSVVLPIVEIELGARWERPIGYGRLFLETGVVGQAWFSAGNSANSGPITGTSFPDQAVTTDTTLGLIGLRIAGGITY